MNKLILPGFRTNVFWKKAVASIYYFFVVVCVSALVIENFTNYDGVFTSNDKLADVVCGMLLIVFIEIILFAPAIALFFQSIANEKLKCNTVIYYIIVTPTVICILALIVAIGFDIADEVANTYFYSEQHKAYKVAIQDHIKLMVAENNREVQSQEVKKNENELTQEQPEVTEKETSVEKGKDDTYDKKTDSWSFKNEVTTSEKYVSGFKIGDFKNALKDVYISGWDDFWWLKDEGYYRTSAANVQKLPNGDAYMIQAEIYTLEDKRNADVYEVQYTISGVQVTDEILLNTLKNIFNSLYGDKGENIYAWAESNLQNIKSKGSASIKIYDGVTVEIELQNSKLNFYKIYIYKVKSIKGAAKTSSNPAI